MGDMIPCKTCGHYAAICDLEFKVAGEAIDEQKTRIQELETLLGALVHECESIPFQNNAEFSLAVSNAKQALLVCPRCKVKLEPGKAIQQTWTGTPEWPGDTLVTMSPGGPGKLVNCLKCPKCGYSVEKTKESQDDLGTKASSPGPADRNGHGG